MSAARKPPIPAPLIGEGPLHQALIEARSKAKVDAFALSTGFAVDEISSDAGKTLDLGRVFDALRRIGYAVSEPTRPQTQMTHGYTTWLVTVTTPKPKCAEVKLAFLKPESGA